MQALPEKRGLALVLGSVVLLCLPLALQREVVNFSADEAAFHLPAIRQIGEKWPDVDLIADSLSATAPGYHYLLATLTLPFGQALPAVRALNLVASLAVLVVLWRALPGPAVTRALLVLPLAWSNFFVKSASFVVTDNAALLASALVLAHVGNGSRRATAGLSFAAAAAIATRQSTAWLVAPLAVRCLDLAAPRDRTIAALGLALPLGLLAALVAAWNGLVPPQWQEETLGRGANRLPAAAYVLSVAALLVPPYLLAFRPAALPSRSVPAAALGAAVGLLAALAAPNLPNMEAGRWGGYLWNLAGALPAFGERSVVFLVLAPVGGAALALFSLAVGRSAARGRIAWLATLGAWTASHLANQQLFHRYYEPTLLLLLVAGAALLLRERSGPIDPRPMAALVAAQLLITLVTAHGRAFGLL